MRKEDMEEVITGYGDMLYRLALVRTGNVQEAQDAVQHTFLKLVENYEKLESQEHVKAWLIRVLCNYCSNLSKLPWKRRRVDVEEIFLYIGDDADCEETVLQKVQKEALWKAIYQLPEKYRTVLHLCYMEEYSPKEIAGLLKLSYNVVCVRLNRAKKQLAEKLDKEDFT